MKLYIVYREIQYEGTEHIAYFTNKKDAELALDDLVETEDYWSSYEIKTVNVNEHSQHLRSHLEKYSVIAKIKEDSILILSVSRVSFKEKLGFVTTLTIKETSLHIVFTATSLKWAKRRAYDEVKKKAKKALLLPPAEPKLT